MPYTAKKPQPITSREDMRRRIPGWGVDLDPMDRPSVPRERFDPGATGAHWEFPDRQPEHRRRERSIEHKFLTPVFGTAQPLKGLSGGIRRYAYRYGEGRAARWIMLLAADRVDACEGHLASMFTRRPDNPITETGVLSEFSHHGLSARVGKRRADVNHQWLDPLIVGGPWVLAGAGVFAAVRAARCLRGR
ncbi:hypothetical protein [Nesterenkonia flava]|uniref:Uncharacterized protein n=1 Tax=Nesterenkonia flava TaxID=469799 RepID=A0ABU1FS78_9MICC|nr:hypothetical protein [Nesterenkonia flava]MDR5711511.1 hypothetical protein [Nesterenkonia flava]